MTTKSNPADAYKYLGDWSAEIRKELKEIRTETENLDSFETRLKIRLETMVLEEKLLEAHLNFVSKNLEKQIDLVKSI